MKLARSLTLGAALALGASIAVAQPPAPRDAPQAEAGARGATKQGPRAQGPRARGTRGPAALGRGPLFQGIELTDAQRAQLRTIGERYRTQARALRPEGRARRGDAGGARPDSAARAQRRTQMVAMRRQLETEMRGVLTPAQQQTFDANRTRLAERMQAARAQRDGHGEPGERRGRSRVGPRSGGR